MASSRSSGSTASRRTACEAGTPLRFIVFLVVADTAEAAKKEEVVALTPWQEQVRSVALTTGGIGGALALGKLTAPAFMNLFTVLGLAGIVGFRAVWSVTPALHSPLMCESPRVYRSCG